MNLPAPMSASQLQGTISNATLNNVSNQPLPQPGENKWFKYVLVGGVILVALYSAYQMSKPTKPIFINKNKEYE